MKYQFGEFTLDLEASRLLGPEGEIRLRPQAFRMLEVLAESAPRILSQEDLLDRVWGVEHLSPASVKQAVSEVRQALGDDPGRPRIIETVHRRGYRFIAPLERVEPEPEPALPEDLPERPQHKEELSTRPLPMAEVLARIEPPPPRAVRNPMARRIGRALPIALLVVPVLVGIAGMTFRERPIPQRQTASAGLTTSAEPRAIRPAVAILGFRNLSATPQDAWISAALSELLGFELSAPGRLRLIPADNVVRMRRELGLAGDVGSPATLARIGRNLGTHLVVTGSYLVSRAEGDEKVRIQIIVQDVRNGETVAWARQTGTREELIDLATSAARGILGTLSKGPAGGPPPEAATLASNGESLRLYSEALQHLRVREATAALPLLQRALGVDPDNPFVHDALATAWAQLGFDGRAADAADKALASSRNLPDEIRLGLEAHAHEVRYEPAEAVRAYEELWRLFPDNLDYGLGLALMQRQAGETEASMATLAALRKLPAPDGDDPRIDLTESGTAWQLGDFALSRDAGSRAAEKAEKRGATLLVAASRASRGWALKRLGENEAALADFQAARAAYERMGDRSAAAGARVAEAFVYQSQGQTAESIEAYKEVIPIFRAVGDRVREAKSLNNYAAVIAEKDLAKTTSLLERSLAIKREIEDLQGQATTLVNIGNLLATQGDTRTARQRLEEAIGISRRLEDAHGVALALRGLSRVHAREGHFEEGRAALTEAVGLSRQIGDAEGLAQAEFARAGLEERAGRIDEARRHYQEAMAHWAKLNDEDSVADMRRALAKLEEKG
jgi:DNA-binding winged helix-turn-helix (wHTH) protein/tetratricopeptide (TPR) repeat protein